jgi:molybdate transport system substrate-binding protein
MSLRLRPARLLTSLVCCVVASACGQPETAAPAARKPLLVFAAASLTAPFGAIETAFEAQHPDVDVQCNFGGSPQLVLQITEGAAADVFTSADTANMQKLVTAGKVVGEPQRFARNRLAIVVKAGNPLGIKGLTDLIRAGVKVALCGPEIPAGRYARQALEKAKLSVVSLSDEPNVKALVAKVLLGELDAGVAYITDGRQKGVEAVAIADEFQVVAEYPIAACKAGANAAAASAFVDFVLSPAGQRLLAEFGFAAP